MVDARVSTGRSRAGGLSGRLGAVGVLCFALLLPGCSIKTMAINALGNALAESGSSFASDDDTELVAAAVPFGLKTIESLLAQSPNHKGLLLAACSGFTRYTYTFVRIRRLCRGAGSGARHRDARPREEALPSRRELWSARFRGRIPRLPRTAPEGPRRGAGRDDAEERRPSGSCTTAGAWASAFALDITDSELSVNQTAIEKMMARALALTNA